MSNIRDIQKNKTIHFRVTEMEKEQISEYAKSLGFKNISSFMMYLLDKEMQLLE